MKKMLSLLLALVCLCLPLMAAAEEPITIDNIRSLVVGVDDPVEVKPGLTRPIINFDNAATTPALRPVVDEVNAKLLTYGSIGRGFSAKSDISTEIYEKTREKVLHFTGASPDKYTFPIFGMERGLKASGIARDLTDEGQGGAWAITLTEVGAGSAGRFVWATDYETTKAMLEALTQTPTQPQP